MKTWILITIGIILATVYRSQAQYPDNVQKFTVNELLHSPSLKSGADFLNTPTMRARVFKIKGDVDLTNHEDAVYYFLHGSGSLKFENNTGDLKPGDIVYISRHSEHHIHALNPLIVLAVYSKANVTDSAELKRFELADIEKKRDEKENTWNAFLRNNTMVFGLYMLPKKAGGDSTLVHKTDELNIVTKGAAKFTIDEYTMTAKKGDIIFVGKGKGHYFHHLEADFDVLILWEKKSISQ